MYTVFRGSLPQGNKKFATYEQARQAVRRWIRANYPVDKPFPSGAPLEGLFSWTTNPQIGDFGYSIRKV